MMVDSKRCHGVTIIGPVAADTSWQARVEGGLTKPAFQVDWERRVATCPAGHESVSWLPAARPNEGMAFEVRFGRKDCTPCPLRPHCTRAKREPRIIWLQERERFEALQGARRHQETEAFRTSYAARAGIEGGVRHGSMRQLVAVEVTATGGQNHGSDPQQRTRGSAGARPDL
jgi:transposase